MSDLEYNKALAKVSEEVEIFKTEYPDYTDEYVVDYLACCDDYTELERALFCRLLGF